MGGGKCRDCPYGERVDSMRVACRRFPPTQVYLDDPERLPFAMFPILKDYEWCYEHPERRPKDA